MEAELVARAESARGELVVRRRPGDVLELRVNGVFVMDTAETSTERLLARAALDAVPHAAIGGEPSVRVLVGGLGLGYTVRELLADPRVTHVLVAEIEPAVVTWMRAGVLPGADVLADPRVQVVTDDVRRVVEGAGEPGSFDVVLLDVDNGPGFLVYDGNAAIYAASFLAGCSRLLPPGGVLAVWSSAYSQSLEADLRDVCGTCTALPVAVDLQGRDERYWLFVGRMTS